MKRLRTQQSQGLTQVLASFSERIKSSTTE